MQTRRTLTMDIRNSEKRTASMTSKWSWVFLRSFSESPAIAQHNLAQQPNGRQKIDELDQLDASAVFDQQLEYDKELETKTH